MTFYEDQQITEDVVEFPPGTELVIHRRIYSAIVPASFIRSTLFYMQYRPFLFITLDTLNPVDYAVHLVPSR